MATEEGLFPGKDLFPGKTFISTVLDALEHKQDMTREVWTRYLMRAAMAGIIVGIMYVANYAVFSKFNAIKLGPAEDASTLGNLGSYLGAWLFGWALVFIYYSKSELLTSNMMIVSIGAYYRKTSWKKALHLLFSCYIGNAVGGLLIALLVWKSSLITGAVDEAMTHAVEHKLAYFTDEGGDWGPYDLLIRAIFCNFCINLAMLLVYSGRIKEDITKSFVMIVSVFLFAFLAFEHSVANTVLFTVMGFQHGFQIEMLYNVVIALIGNMIGGGLLIGLYYAYVNDDTRFVRDEPTV